MPPVWVTSKPTLSNYAIIFGLKGMVQSNVLVSGVTTSVFMPLFNSLVISLSATILSMVLGSMAAWAISRFRVGGNSFALGLLAPRMFPPIAIALPMLIMYSSLHLVNTRIGLIIAYTGFTIPFSVWMTKSFIDEVPVELEEAAMMDGQSRFETFYKTTLPVVKGGLAATFLFIFILNWSEFLLAQTLMRSVHTIPVYISLLYSAAGGKLYGVQAAIGAISVLPMILIGYSIQEHLARGFTFGVIRQR
ncbi:MAG: carbohydrate ABC transporter permease [Halanaeroarchaeum sp.]